MYESAICLIHTQIKYSAVQLVSLVDQGSVNGNTMDRGQSRLVTILT